MKKLLVIRLGAMGDLLHMSASLSVLSQQRPEVEIHVLTAPMYRELVASFPGVHTVWTYDKRKPWQELRRLVGELRQNGVDQVINLHPSLKIGLLVLGMRPARQQVYRKEKLSVRGSAQRGVDRRHAVMDFFQPFQAMFQLEALPMLRPVLPVQADRQDWVGFIPGVGAKRGNRAWGLSQYQQLIAQLLVCTSSRIVLIGGPDEAQWAEQLVQDPRVENHCGRHTILETARLLATCRLVVGGDTGPLHLAAAVGVPMVSIYGPTSLDRTGPVGAKPFEEQPMISLTPPEPLTCWPCERVTCPLTGDQYLACMNQITVDHVLAACAQVLASEKASSI